VEAEHSSMDTQDTSRLGPHQAALDVVFIVAAFSHPAHDLKARFPRRIIGTGDFWARTAKGRRLLHGFSL
jgi:hypothetical protein